jgi:hypothetical protein
MLDFALVVGSCSGAVGSAHESAQHCDIAVRDGRLVF